jgi:rod shape-determining protein MreD
VRTAVIVLVAYVGCVIVATVWRVLPFSFLHDAIPDLGALTAAYLGLTARRGVAAPVGGSVVLGYLIDVISGTPPGLGALVLGLSCLIARAAQQRILVRGTAMTMGFSAFVAVIVGVVGLIVSVIYGVPRAGAVIGLQHLALVTLATAIVGPVVYRVFRRIDAAFARTHRERDHALEGLNP